MICRIWAFHIVLVVGSWGEQIRLPSWADAKAPGVSPGFPFPWALVGGPSRLFPNPISFPQPLRTAVCARVVLFLESDATSTCLLRAGLVGLSRRHVSCDNDDLLVFVPIPSSSFSFF